MREHAASAHTHLHRADNDDIDGHRTEEQAHGALHIRTHFQQYFPPHRKSEN